MNPEEYIATDLSTYLSAIVTATRNFDNNTLWWRGQSRKSWSLHPSIYHRDLAKNETNMCVQFRNQAKVRHRDVPDIHDTTSWLFLMQHYGLPTRLLDWSDSPLIALFFAIKNITADDEDGVIYGLSPTDLNFKEIALKGIVGTGNPTARKVFDNAWVNPGEKKDATNILAINTQHVDIRQMVQASQFTIHGINTSLHELDGASEYLVSIIIPREFKEAFRQIINLFHINDSYLFPDLEHLARQIQSLNYSENQ